MKAKPDEQHPSTLDECRRCDLWRNATQPVGGQGARHAKLMLVGEQPGDQEDLAGKPFVGPAGDLLDEALEAAGIDRRQVYITNAVKHFKWEPRGKRRMHKTPAQKEVAACHYWLEAELESVAPDVIVALGATALKSVLQSGGVGQLVARMASRKGGRVIGTAGSSEKAAIALAAGCDEVILYRDEDVAVRVMAFTGGAGVGAAYDAVGADTFEGSLASLGIKGHLVHYGQASGPIPPFDLSRLGAKSAKVSRPFLWPYISTRETLLSASEKLFAAMAAGALPVTLGGRFDLRDAAKAHAALEARAAGPFVLDC